MKVYVGNNPDIWRIACQVLASQGWRVRLCQGGELRGYKNADLLSWGEEIRMVLAGGELEVTAWPVIGLSALQRHRANTLGKRVCRALEEALSTSQQG